MILHDNYKIVLWYNESRKLIGEKLKMTKGLHVVSKSTGT